MEKAAVVICVNNVVGVLMDSSSSSDEEEMCVLQERNIVPRVKGFVESVINMYSEADFKKNLRVTRSSAMYLIERYSLSYYKRTYQGGKEQTTAETQILCFLWFSGNKNTLREVANLFNISLSGFHRSFNKVLTFFAEELAPEVIKFPKTNDEKQALADDFKKISGFPNVLGCIDGSHISVRKPKHKIRSTYANRHDGLSLTMQGICDANLRFLDVFTGIPTKIHDSRILKLSFIGKDLPRLCSPEYHLLGDAAYPLREYLLTPYRDYGNLSQAEKKYNLKFCQTRVKIENSFGALKGRFHQLIRLDFQNVDTMAQFIIACCVLHNICIDRGNIYNEEICIDDDSDVNIEPIDDERRDCLLSQLGKIKRDEIKDRLI